MRVYQKISFVSAVLIGLVIFYVSSLEFSGIGCSFHYLSFVYHLFIFFLFGFFLFLSIKFEREEIFLVLIICLVYAALDELHQFFVPGRFPSVLDVFTDFLGSSFSLLFLSFGRFFRRS